jgi:hypothetical protein
VARTAAARLTQALDEKDGEVLSEQVERIDRLMRIVEASDPYKVMSGLSFYDVIVFTMPINGI